MGLQMCSGELKPENYPIEWRNLRKPFDYDEEGLGLSSSASRASMIKNMVHVMSYNLLADQLATPDYHTSQAKEILDFQFRGPRIIEEIGTSDASLLCLQELDHIDDFYDQNLKELGFNIIYGMRQTGNPEPHTIAVAYKAEEWFLIDVELVDLGKPKQWFLNEPEFAPKAKNAILCLFKHQQSHKTIVVANAHFDHNPNFDEVKFAQAVYLLERSAKYVRTHKGNEETLPFICCGDFNSLPVSSVLSVFYNENIDQPELRQSTWPSLWTIPAGISENKIRVYQDCNRRLQRLIEMGQLDPLIGNLASAYQNYDLPVGRVPSDQTLSRAETMPKYTNYKVSFQGTLDHIFYNTNQMKVVELLEVPQMQQIVREKAIPSTLFSSDHVRIETIFVLK